MIEISLKAKRILSITSLLMFLFFIYLRPTFGVILEVIIFLSIILIPWIIILFFVKENKQKRYENILYKISMFYLILSLIFILLGIFIALNY
jgi:hypothetical protein